MRDEGNPVRSFIDSTRKCCSSLGGLVSSLIKHCTFLVGSLPEDNHSTEMEPIDISSTDSDSDSWDLAKYKALNDRDDQTLVDSASTNNVRHLPQWASTSGTGVTGHESTQKVPRSKRASQFNGNSSIRDNHAQSRSQIHPSSNDNVRISNSNLTREDKSKHLSSNGYGRTLPSSLQASGSNGYGRTHPSSLQASGSNGYGRTLPSSLQASGSIARPISLNSAGSSHAHENPSVPAWSDPRYGKSLLNDHMGRGRDAESSMFRRLPATIHPSSVPTTPYVGPNDPLHRSVVVDEKIGDERLIYQAALQDLNQPKVEAELPLGLLSVPLLKHQKIALAWMNLKETKSAACRGGILADDQGLGKTISMLALIQLEKSQSKLKPDDSSTPKAEALNLDDDDEDKGDKTGESEDVKLIPQASTSTSKFQTRRPAAGTLVVCPASVVRQWARELDEKVPEESKLSVLVYHGGNRTKSPSELANYDVVVTTYAIVSNEVPKQPLVEEEDDQKDGEQYGLSSHFSSNKKRKALTTSKKGKKGRKGLDSCLTDYDCGTLARVSWFRVILDEAQTIKNHRTLVARSCCGLKAKTRWCLSGTPIQNSIDELYSYFRFLKYEPYLVYKYFINNIKIPIARDSFRGYKKLQAVLKTVMLRRTKGTLLDGEPIINLPAKTIHLTRVDFSTEEREFYSKLEGDSRSQFKAYAAAGTLKQNYANILLMLLRLRQACDHPLLVKGFNSDSVSRVSGKMAKRLPRDMQIDLLKHLETSLAICCVCRDPPEDAVVSICGHVFCYQCVSEYLTGDDNTCPSPECKEVLGVDAVFSKATLRRCISDDDDDDDGNNSSSSAFTERSKVFQNEYSSSKIRAALEIIQTYCKKGQCSELHNLDGCNENSSNLENSSSGLGTEGPIKAIVFSQWTRMLDLVEMALNKNCIEYRRLDGSMSLASRDRAVKEFNTDPEVTVMLMSLKAGNLGLNMVAASHVILLDLWWNPTTEDQAIDRAHRIGQTRPVTVSRLTIKDTVEDRILALQEEKRKMVASAFGEDSSGTTATRLTAEDLRYLFMGVY